MNGTVYRTLYRILAPVILGVLLVACGGTPGQTNTTGGGGATTTAGTNLTRIRLGYVPVMIYAPLFVAAERGYFTQEGLNVELSPLQGGSDSVVQLAAGNFDVAVGGAGAGLFNAAKQGVKFTIVAPMHSERPPDTTSLVISAKRKNEIKSVADLKGKKVAINATGAATEWWLAEALRQGGLTVDDVQVTALAFRDVPAALENGALDAAMLGDPLTTINVDKGIVAILSNDFINGFVSTFLYMGEPVLTKNSEAARGFLRAYLRACRDLQGNYMNPEIAGIIEKYTQVPADVVMRSAPALYDPQGRVPIEDLNTLQNYFLTRGVLEYSSPLDITTFVNTEMAAQAAAQLGAQ